MGRRVLIVEDEERIRDVLARALTRKGFTVSLAANGSEGLRLAQECSPEVILSDVLMPVLSGPEMIQRLRATGISVPAVLMSGHTGSFAGMVDSMLAEGVVQGFLEKPFNHLNEVVDLLNRV